jgi:transcriptional regulator with XRE-family HTH domain
LSQADFSALVGLDPRVYASYEYARSRLNYPAAWRILSAFRLLNPRWLAEGKGMPFEIIFAPYASPEEASLGQRALFSMEYERLLKSRLASAPSLWMLPDHRPLPYLPIQPSLQGRIAAKDVLAELIVDWLAAQPDAQVSRFVNDLLQAGVDLLKKYPPELGAAKKKRFSEMFRIEAKRRGIFPALTGAKWMLTDIAISANLPPVKSQLDSLLVDLNRLTKERGMKTKLADYLGAPLASVSRWLSGEIEPGGETTLRMLEWVQAEEAKPKGPGGAITPPEPKTQVRKSKTYEKANSSPPKR